MAGTIPFQYPDHSSPSDPDLDRNPRMPQLTGDQGRGLLLTESEFRIGVNLPPDSDEIVFQLRRLIQKTNREREEDTMSF
jgi:hypothetical protein